MMPYSPEDAGRSRLSAMGMGASPQEGLQPKGAVNYRPADTPAESCGACVHFDGQGACELVAGRIDPRGLSDLFESAEEQQSPEAQPGLPV